MIIIKDWSTSVGIFRANTCFKNSFLGDKYPEMHPNLIYIRPPRPVTGLALLFFFYILFHTITNSVIHSRIAIKN
jgi:hypothetical protein